MSFGAGWERLSSFVEILGSFVLLADLLNARNHRRRRRLCADASDTQRAAMSPTYAIGAAVGAAAGAYALCDAGAPKKKVPSTSG